MKYRVHRINVNSHNIQDYLEKYLNNLNGEVISVIPNVTTTFLLYGAKTDFLLIVEKV